MVRPQNGSSPRTRSRCSPSFNDKDPSPASPGRLDNNLNAPHAGSTAKPSPAGTRDRPLISGFGRPLLPLPWVRPGRAGGESALPIHLVDAGGDGRAAPTRASRQQWPRQPYRGAAARVRLPHGRSQPPARSKPSRPSPSAPVAVLPSQARPTEDRHHVANTHTRHRRDQAEDQRSSRRSGGPGRQPSGSQHPAGRRRRAAHPREEAKALVRSEWHLLAEGQHVLGGVARFRQSDGGVDGLARRYCEPGVVASVRRTEHLLTANPSLGVDAVRSQPDQ